MRIPFAHFCWQCDCRLVGSAALWATTSATGIELALEAAGIATIVNWASLTIALSWRFDLNPKNCWRRGLYPTTRHGYAVTDPHLSRNKPFGGIPLVAEKPRRG